MPRLIAILILATSYTTACGSSPTGSETPDAHAVTDSTRDAAGSQINALPFSGGPDAPVVASVEYRCNTTIENALVEAQVVITDPQGPGDLQHFTDDHLGMFAVDPPSGAERVVGFQLEIDGVHWAVSANSPSDTWGAFFAQLQDTEIYTTICASSTWPMDVLVVDQSGHVTSGLVRGTRVDPPL